MMHRRSYQVIELGPAQLAHRLARHTFTLCTGFLCQGLLWLNDSTSEDAVQEYAVVNVYDAVQIESITVSWCTPAEIEEICARLDEHGGTHLGRARYDLNHRGECLLCA